jgi:MerR family transcriptional regulator, heat shock protein HspR
MAAEYWTIEQIVEELEISNEFVVELIEEEIVTGVIHQERGEPLFSEQEIDRMRLAHILVHEMGVNLAGVDIILNMRSTILEMRQQMDGILAHVAHEVRKSIKKMESDALIR